MSINLIAKVTVTIDAPVGSVWDALTNPALIKQYFFGAEAVSDWKVGSPLYFKGMWNGKEYVDKGTILMSQPEKIFQYNYYSSLSGLPDTPENYAIIIYELVEEDDNTLLTVKQENIADEETKENAEKNWTMVLNGLKNLLEKKPVTQES